MSGLTNTGSGRECGLTESVAVIWMLLIIPSISNFYGLFLDKNGL